MKNAIVNMSLLFACFLTFAFTAFAEDQYVGTIAPGGNNVAPITPQADGGYSPTFALPIAPGSLLTLQNPDGGVTSACVSSLDAGCAHPVQLLPGYPLFTKCKPSPSNYIFTYTLLDGGSSSAQYTGCLIQSPTALDVFIRRGDELR